MLYRCPDCFSPVSKSATACPRCGRRLRASDGLRLLNGLIIAGAILMILKGLAVVYLL